MGGCIVLDATANPHFRSFFVKNNKKIDVFFRKYPVFRTYRCPKSDFVPLIRKHFDALITDEGGILCHAAIVAREIPISCIVETGVATNILKDGMWIWIDFDRGEIEIKIP